MERWRSAYLAAEHARTPLTNVTGQIGTGLLEVLTATVCFGVLMAMAYAFVRNALCSARVQEDSSAAQEVTLMALDLWVREMRLAGFSASGAPLLGVRAASPERVEVAADFDGDGDSNEPNELVAYSYNALKRELVRATGGGSPQPLVSNVPPDGLEFRFFDAGGREISAAGEPLSADDRRRIHRMDMRLRVILAGGPAGPGAVVSAVSGSACLRNQ